LAVGNVHVAPVSGPSQGHADESGVKRVQKRREERWPSAVASAAPLIPPRTTDNQGLAAAACVAAGLTVPSTLAANSRGSRTGR
jgi:hypothetical protein